MAAFASCHPQLEPNTTEPSKVVTSLYPRGRGTIDVLFTGGFRASFTFLALSLAPSQPGSPAPRSTSRSRWALVDIGSPRAPKTSRRSWHTWQPRSFFGTAKRRGPGGLGEERSWQDDAHVAAGEEKEKRQVSRWMEKDSPFVEAHPNYAKSIITACLKKY